MLMLISYNFLQAMNGYAQILSTAQINTRIKELWQAEGLSEEQKIAKLQLFFKTAENKLMAKFYSEALNPKEPQLVNPLDDAMTGHDSVSLFKFLLAHKANPRAEIGMKGSIVSRAEYQNQEYKKAIEAQAIIDLVEPELALALLGAHEQEIAIRLKELMIANKISEDALFEVLDVLVLRKQTEFEILDNVSIALQNVLRNKPYKRRESKEKITLRSMLAAKDVPYSALQINVAADDNNTAALGSTQSTKIYASPVILTGALACIGIGFGGKYLFDALSQGK
jgi:hypothetical protein